MMNDILVVLFVVFGPVLAAFLSLLVIVFLRERLEWNQMTRIQRNNKPGGYFY